MIKPDDPAAAAKLIADLDRRKVRIEIAEMCRYFGYEKPTAEQVASTAAFLDDLVARGELHCFGKGLRRLYYRPAAEMKESALDLDAKPEKPKRGRKPRPARDKAGLEAEAAALLAYARKHGTEVPKDKLADHASRLGLARERLVTVLHLLCEKGELRKGPFAYQVVGAEAPAAPAKPPRAERPKRDYRYDSRAEPPAAPGKAWPQLKTSASFSLYHRECWIQIWLNDNPGTTRLELSRAAVALNIVEAAEDLDLAFEGLVRRNRLYEERGRIVVTKFGEADADLLSLRREAFGFAPRTGA